MAATLAKHQANRWPALLEAAATLFAERGYHATTIRDVAQAAGVTPGALYFHVPTKQALLIAVYTEGVDRIVRHVDNLVDREIEPALRFRRAIEAHLEFILDASAFARVIVRVVPDDVPEVAAELRAQRDRYETRFRALIAALELPSGRSPTLLRMLLLGALNSTPIWYRRARGDLDAIVDEFIAVFGVASTGTSGNSRQRPSR